MYEPQFKGFTDTNYYISLEIKNCLYLFLLNLYLFLLNYTLTLRHLFIFQMHETIIDINLDNVNRKVGIYARLIIYRYKLLYLLTVIDHKK